MFLIVGFFLEFVLWSRRVFVFVVARTTTGGSTFKIAFVIDLVTRLEGSGSAALLLVIGIDTSSLISGGSSFLLLFRLLPI